MYFYVEVPDAPLQGLLVGAEEDVEPVSTDGAAPVENFYGKSIVVAGDNHFCPEGVSLVGRHEDVAWFRFVPAGRYTVRILATAFWAGAIGRYAHLNGFPFAGRFVRGASRTERFGLRLYQGFAMGRLRDGL